MSWPEAQSYCREKYTDLATVDNMDDVNRLVNIVDAGYSGSVWIGLKRGTQTRWAWSNGENKSSPYSNWASGEPNGIASCVSYYKGFWVDMDCSSSLYFTCYTENNGYLMAYAGKTWSDAQSICRENHIDLPSIHNSEDHNQITKILSSVDHVWIGLFQDSWEWSDKWSLFFRNWAEGQPSQSSGSDCVSMSRINSGKWAHESCDLKHPFICHGDGKLKQIVKLKLSCNGKYTLNDPSIQTAILNEISEKLKSMGLESDSKISWRKGEGGEVFHQEINRTASSNNKCNKK
ncbi:macrophage mannose receptor 1-like [Megalobrama amblycephala]|uniref:macrophage mannose receptor 1-like n=1 Tax=Megalobrama amblycephala TaxID=75352 RepID=UPI0020147847|nr:macrophage mannose receptor 1-like [Megalobrama amblycephala]